MSVVPRDIRSIGQTRTPQRDHCRRAVKQRQFDEPGTVARDDPARVERHSGVRTRLRIDPTPYDVALGRVQLSRTGALLPCDVGICLARALQGKALQFGYARPQSRGQLLGLLGLAAPVADLGR